MEKFKKLICVFILIIGLFACGSNDESPNKEKQKKAVVNKTKTLNKEVTPTKTEKTKEVEEEKVAEYTQSLIEPGLKSYSFQEINNKNTLVLEFYRDIKNNDLNSYIDIQGKNLGLSSKNIVAIKNKIYIREDFLSNTDYKLVLFKGLAGLEKDDVISIKVPLKEPKVEFKSNGIYMTNSLDKKLRIRTLNLKSMNLIIKKITLEDLNLFIYTDSINSGKKDDSKWNARTAQTIYSKEVNIKGEEDKWIESDIDLSFFDNDKTLVNGIYSIEIIANKENVVIDTGKSFYKDIEKTIIISNLGVLAKKYDDKTIVYVKNLEDNSSVADAEVFIGLKKYRTNKNGEVIILNENWDKIFVKKGDNIAFLNSKNYVDYSLADNGGIYKNDKINPYIYLTQGVYRPGDKVNISTILYEKNKKLPDNQKLVMEIYTPKGGLYTTINGKSQGNSLYTFDFKTKESDFTGTWQAKLYLGEVGDENFLKSKNISIETIVPPSIEVHNNSSIDGKIINTKINSNYLFGAPGKNLGYKITVTSSLSNYKFKGYENFNFISNTNDKFKFEETRDGFLDENGNITEKFEITAKKPKYIVDYHIKSEVFQNDGRKVVKSKTVSYSPYDEYVGIEKKGDDYFEVGKEIQIGTVALSKDGKKLEKDLEYKIYENTSYYWWDYSSYGDFTKHYKSSPETSIYSSGKIKSGEKILFKVPKSGYFYVEVSDSDGHSAGTMVETSYWGEGASKNDTFTKISSDKKSYDLNDEALITFKSPSTGKALVNIEDGKKLLKRDIIDIKEGDNQYKFKVTKNMFPGAYINIIMLQDLKKKENDMDLKIQGLKYFEVKDKNKIIPIIIENKKVYKDAKNIEVTLKGIPGMTYTVAAVDVGVLNMTNFKTPDPYSYFNQKQRYEISNYDNYKQVLDFQKDPAYNTFKPGGGEVLENKRESSLSKKPRFKIASQFKSGIADEEGNVNLKFDLGNYMGKIRFMVIAAKDDKLGRVEATSEIRDDVVLLPGAPRSLTPGDKFESNLTIFVNKEYSKNSTVKIETKGPISVVGKNQYDFDGSKLGQLDFNFDLEVGNTFDNGELIYTVTNKDNNTEYKNIMNIQVEPKLDTVNYSEEYKVEPNKTISFTARKENIRNSSNSKVIISKFPLKGFYGRLRYLIKYPYGCVEQTTSSVFPQLYVENFMNLTQAEKEEVHNNVEAGIKRLQKFQLSNGSLSYWIGENYTSNWGTNYAYYFLLSAKDRGYYIPENMLNSLRAYMIKKASSTRENNTTNLQRLYLLALDNRANLSAMNYYKQNYINKMTDVERLLLASSYDKAGYSETAKSLSKNVDLKTIGEKEKDRWYWYYSFGSRLRDKSLALISVENLKSKEEKKEIQDKILEELSSDNWLSTQTTAYSLLAISKNIENTSNKEVKYTCTDPDKLSNKVSRSFEGKSETLNLNKLQGKKVEVTNNSDTTLYATYYFEGVLDPKDQIDYSSEIGLSVKYYTEEGVEIPNFNSLKKGESIWGVYKISKKRNSSYTEIVLNQNLASGIEIENLRLNNDKIPDWLKAYEENSINLRYQDIRDSRVSYFMDLDDSNYYDYSNNTSTENGYIILKLNAVTKGKFFMPGPTIKDMYHDEISAGVKGFYLEVK